MHTGWHMKQAPPGEQPPGAEPTGTNWNADSAGLSLLREAFSIDRH